MHQTAMLSVCERDEAPAAGGTPVSSSCDIGRRWYHWSCQSSC